MTMKSVLLAAFFMPGSIPSIIDEVERWLLIIARDLRAQENLNKPMPQYISASMASMVCDAAIDVALEDTGLTKADIIGDRRQHALAHARQEAVFIAKAACPAATLVEIGRLFGNRDHSTILHSVNKIRHMVTDDLLYARRIEAMTAKVLAIIHAEAPCG
jgi:chromosomal replication initiation ATPase DnaA